MTRAESMDRHLIKQFQGKKIIDIILKVIGEELDEIDKALADLRDKRWIDTGEGVQLDGIGELIDRPREIAGSVQIEFFGFADQPNARTFGEGRFRDTDATEYLASSRLEDHEYRPVLWHKVMKNISSCTAEETIKSAMFVFNAPSVALVERGNAKISLAIGRELSDNDIVLGRALNLFIKAGGVGLEWSSQYDYDSYFGFLGQPNAKGFDNGKFSDLIEI